jgi:hypothetical protein
MGLLWLEAKGFVQVVQQRGTAIWLAAGSGIKSLDCVEIEAELESMLTETAAYRSYFKTTKNNLT